LISMPCRHISGFNPVWQHHQFPCGRCFFRLPLFMSADFEFKADKDRSNFKDRSNLYEYP
jgi:hypothetical protein